MALSHLKRLNGAVVYSIKKNIKLHLTEAPKYLDSIVKSQHKEVVYNKFTDVRNWYSRVLGLDEVKLFQDRVISLQDQLMKIQEKRRDVGRQLAEVRKKSNDLQDEIHKVKRTDDLQKFLTLMKDEAEVLKLEHETQQTFQEYDQAEREIFTAFANAIRDSHEKQRAQLEYTKYFGVILSIIGSFLAFCYTTIRKNDLKYYIEKSLGSYSFNFEEIRKNLENNDQKLDRIAKYVNDENLNALEFVKKNSGPLQNLLRSWSQARNDGTVMKPAQPQHNPPNIITDSNSISLTEPSIFEENRIIKYALYAGLGLLLLKVISPN